MDLPNDDPSNPGLPAPLFADVDAVRGDQLRASMQLIWGNFDYIEDNFDAEAKAAALAALLTGFSATNSVITAADAVLAALGKAQGQINALSSGKQVTLKRATLRDQKANNTDGGTATGGGRQRRDLNTELDPDSIVTISSNKFTPVAGTYLIKAHAPAQDVGRHRAYLYNETAAADVTGCAGTNAYTAGGGFAQTDSVIFGSFTANGTDEFSIQHYLQNNISSIGLGNKVADGNPEIYTVVDLLKIA